MIEINGIAYNVISTKSFIHKGEDRKELKMQKLNGRKFFYVVVYANGSMSEVV